jgi:hypothetical protein
MTAVRTAIEAAELDEVTRHFNFILSDHGFLDWKGIPALLGSCH